MSKVSSNLRSTAIITQFVTLSDEAKSLAARLKALTAELALLTPDVLAQIGPSRAVLVNKAVRVLMPSTKTSISCIADDQTVVEYCKANGLKYQERSAEYVASATFGKYVRESLVPADFYETTETTSVVVQ